MEVLTQIDIDNLLAQLQEASLETSIIDIKPAEIAHISDSVVKEKMYSRFTSINDLYVTPLKKVLDNYTNKTNSINYKQDFSEYSIMDRIKYIQKILIKYGYTADQLVSLVPKREEEVNLIVEAKKNGFIETGILDNESRLNEARKYVEEKEENISGPRL